MDILNRVSQTISDAGQKTREAADIASLNGKISDNDRQIKQLYAAIGEAYYEAHSKDADDCVLEDVTKVNELKAQNEEWKDQIQGLKGLVKCPNCGEYVPKDTPYCTSCGQRLLSDDEVVCPSCGRTSAKGMQFCQFCGARLPEQSQKDNGNDSSSPLICKCGNAFPDDAQFCPVCGTSREEAINAAKEDS